MPFNNQWHIIMRHETLMSLPVMSLGDMSSVRRKEGTGGGGWVHQMDLNSMAMSGHSCERPLVGAGCAILFV